MKFYHMRMLKTAATVPWFHSDCKICKLDYRLKHPLFLSSDLNPYDLCLWDFFKSTVYDDNLSSLAVLKDVIHRRFLLIC